MEFETVVWHYSYATVSEGVGNELDAAPFFHDDGRCDVGYNLEVLTFCVKPNDVFSLIANAAGRNSEYPKRRKSCVGSSTARRSNWSILFKCQMVQQLN
jgi:hypothetical protein